MKSKEKLWMGREDLAKRLRKVADMVEEGTIRLGEASVEMPEEVEYEMELEQDPSEIKFEIEVEWRRQSM